MELLFKLITIFCALMVINVRNPVYSIIFLILVFVNAAGLLLYLGVEFLGMVFLVVYIGAIAVLFLFVVMMINIRYVELSARELFYLPLNGLFLMIPLSLEIGFYFYFTELPLASSVTLTHDYTFLAGVLGNAEILGYLLYSPRFFIVVLLAALILLVAMVGAIVLTLSRRYDVRKQDIFEQLTRDFDDATKNYELARSQSR